LPIKASSRKLRTNICLPAPCAADAVVCMPSHCCCCRAPRSGGRSG
jgi:hypothetical protein